jgi:molybdopterin-guanine dinucleotide biosynthesis protein A
MKGLAILILAGGDSKRFGGEKAFFEIEGRPMIQRVVEEVSKLSGEIVISCRTGLERLAIMYPEAKIIPDKWDKKGALTGIVSALPEVESDYVALVTCDCPKIKSGVIEMLFKSARGHDGATPRWPNGYIDPLQAVYRTKKLQVAAQKVWERGKMRLADVLKMLPDVVYVSTEELKKVDPKLESFLNVNLPEDVVGL